MIFFQSCNSYLKEFQKKNFQSDYNYNKFLILGTWINMIYCNDFQNSDTNQVGK